MKKPETLHHSLMYCLKVAVMLLLFALAGNYCLAKEKTPTQVKSDKLVIYASSKEELNTKLLVHFGCHFESTIYIFNAKLNLNTDTINFY